ncbi:type II toxin-antitoxin system RelE/ParE family toxin [Erwinia sp. JUb26]|uniref:type II toxin-antitoxin system RelE family toxin n=1 Tax=Erwinia sp. JUb26 TaxID=2485126 RepID=UPI000F4A4E48|nr:type II toxin-antitoxin system RelE/ParE family toxin [Erwinia sp. JUb26]ROR14751.1 mRNA interferase RelE/StbE [Erwinia sp. JUb26]
MTYKLAFNESALKEWKKLGHTIQEQFKKKLRERLQNPRVPASQLHGRKDQYKIKLSGAGYRLVYRVEDDIVTVTVTVTVTVIGVGKRENDDIYNVTRTRS